METGKNTEKQQGKEEEKRLQEQIYLSEHPKEKEVHELLEKATKIQGTFYSEIRGKKKEWKNITIHIKKIKFLWKESKIEIRDNEGEAFLIYINNREKGMGKLGLAGNRYMLIELTDIDAKNIQEYINKIIKVYY